MTEGEVFESLLSAAQAGAEWAFSRLYVEFNPRLERYFAARSPRFAEDLAAETWMGVARKISGFQGDERQFRSWLFTIAHRRLVDHWKTLNRRTEDPYDPADLQIHQQADDEDLEQSVIDAAAARAAARRIAKDLNQDQAEVVLLRLLGDLDVDQVAEILGKRPGTIRVLQHRALKKLAKESTLENVTD